MTGRCRRSKSARPPTRGCSTGSRAWFSLANRLQALLADQTANLASGGGLNPVEAAKLGCAILHGPNVGDFEDAYTALYAAGGCALVHDAETLASEVSLLLLDSAELREMGRAAADAVERRSGASTRIMQAIAPVARASLHRARLPSRMRRRIDVARAARDGQSDPAAAPWLLEPQQFGLGTGVRLLQIDVPVAQILDADRDARRGAAHKGAWPQNAELAVEILDFGFSGGDRAAFIAVHGIRAHPGKLAEKPKRTIA